MSKPASVAKPSPLTYELMLIGHSDVLRELQRLEAGFRPRTNNDADTLRRMLVAIEEMMRECRAQNLH